MKTFKFIISILIICFYFILPQDVFAQTEKPDTIFMLGGRQIYVKIIGVSASRITYKEVGKTNIETVDRKQVQKIVYKTGAKEIFNKPVFQELEAGDWRTVILTKDAGEVQGLEKKGEVSATSSSGSRTKKSAKRSAEIRLQKKAANLGAQIILVTKSVAVGGYGEIPSYEMEGIAYGIPMF